jgi:hypothetical protein
MIPGGGGGASSSGGGGSSGRMTEPETIVWPP